METEEVTTMPSLRVLIVHAGTSAPEQRTKAVGGFNQHTLVFKKSAKQKTDGEPDTSKSTSIEDEADPMDISFEAKSPKDCSSIISLDDFDFLLLHSGNPEAELAVDCLRKRGEKGKVIFFTGGGGLASKFEDSRIPNLPHKDGASSLLSLQWDNVPSDFDGTADELVGLLDPQPVEVLSALSILCQGYLAAHAEEYVHAEGQDEQKKGYWKPREISDALKQMEWTEDHLAHTANGQPEKATQLDWWRSSFEDTDDLVGEAKAEWNDAANWSGSAVKDLLGRITDGEEPLQGEEDRRIIADAYRELEKKLRGTS